MTEQINREGLSREQVSASRNKYGENVLTPPKKTSLWKLYIDKYRDPIIEILLVAAAISLVLAFINNDFMETLGIFLAIFLATTVGFYFEVDAAKKFNVLTAMNDDQPVKVRREGKVMEIPRREVVVGDIILVEVGDEIPADAQLLSAVNLQVDESALTGEPLTTKSLNADDKDRHAAAYPTNIILRSTMVMNGHGEAVVYQRPVAYEQLFRHGTGGAQLFYDGCDAHRHGGARGLADGREPRLGAEHAAHAQKS